jgi:hypothetical protein
LLLYTHTLICEYRVISCFLHWMCIIILDFVFFFLYEGKKDQWKSCIYIKDYKINGVIFYIRIIFVLILYSMRKLDTRKKRIFSWVI